MVDSTRVRSTLLRLLEMNTPSGRERIAADYLETELQKMGFATWRDDAGAAIGGETGNLLARLEGAAPGSPALLLNAHMDTVAPTEGLVIREEEGVLRASGTTILGADDKAGITAVLEGVRGALAAGFPRPTLEIAFTVSEEVGLLGARHLDYAALTARQAYAFDSGQPVGGIVSAAPSQNTLAATVRGVASHAGVAPEKGVNAIRIAAEAISRMALGRIDAETTANIGVIHGGQATNIIPDRVVCRGEVRSRSEEKLESQTQAIVAAFAAAASAAGGSVEVDVERAYTRFSVPEDHPLVQRAIEAGRRVGIGQATVRAGGGGSDANFLNANGIPAVVIGLGYDNVHGVEEYIALSDGVLAATIAMEIIRLVGEGK